MLHVKQWCKWFPSDTITQEKSRETTASGNKRTGNQDHPSKLNLDRHRRENGRKIHHHRSGASPRHNHDQQHSPNGNHEKNHESRLKPSTQNGFDPILRTQQWVQQCIQQGISEESEKEQDDIKAHREEESPCCICHALKPDHALYPCGHLCICQPCKPALHSSFKCCPICSQTFTDVIKIFKI